MIRLGVSIGDGAATGMGAASTGDIGPGEIAGGHAARAISARDAVNIACKSTNEKVLPR